MTTTTGPTSHANMRGNSRDRFARRQYLLDTFGNGVTAPCWECCTNVGHTTMVVDRIVPGIDGGRYVRSNIRVHCHNCSNLQGYALGMGANRIGN